MYNMVITLASIICFAANPEEVEVEPPSGYKSQQHHYYSLILTLITSFTLSEYGYFVLRIYLF